MAEPLHIPSDDLEEDASNETPNDEGRLALDIFETDESIYVVAPLAGVDPKEVEISVSEDVLTIRGNREFPAKLPEPKSFFTEECFWGKFSRSIVLPSAVNSADIKAQMKKNVLVVAIPKAKKATKKIMIET
jgi:HSP20 family protein